MSTRQTEAVVRVGKAKTLRRVLLEGDGAVEGSLVVVRSDRGTELGTVVSTPRAVEPRSPDDLMRMGADEFWEAFQTGCGSRRCGSESAGSCGSDKAEPAVQVLEGEARFLRLANQEDVLRSSDLEQGAEVEELAFFREQIIELGLPMKAIDVEHLLGGEKVVFFFTSEQRVDFRQLVRVLAQRFHCRVELRRISPRDAAGMQGGVGICGETLCCSSWMQKIEPVTIKMARVQNRPIADDANLGACGRLRCCLRYELTRYPGGARLAEKKSRRPPGKSRGKLGSG